MLTYLSHYYQIDPERSALGKSMQWLGLLACALLAVFIAWTTAFGRMPGEAQTVTALTLGLIAIYTTRTGPLAGWSQGLDDALSIVLLAASVATGAYFFDQYDDIASMREGIPNPADLTCYAVGMLCVFEAARRVEGWILVGVALAAVAYMLFGNYLPGVLHHRPFWIEEVLEYSYSGQGIYGIALSSVVSVVLVFVLLGVALRITGAGEFFNFLAMRLTRGRRSGPAQAAIVASALFGSINGSAPANVAATGVLTIPLMRRSGYSASFAGAVEATASCVGQIMPPVMGVGAFIMSEITGISYAKIMLASTIPALLFILSMMAAVALKAAKEGIEPLDAEEDLAFDATRKAQAVTLLSGFAVLLGLLFSGFSPTYCGLMATGAVLAVSTVFAATRLALRDVPVFFIDSGRDGLAVMIACAAIGVVIAAFSTTGLGIKINQMILAMGGHSLVAALVLSAICAIVLGMGLPTAASYLMVVFVAGPAIMKLGVPLLQTHLFIFYYAVLSAITPPVALAIFAAAAIAKESPLKIAAYAMKLSVVAFTLPLAWVYHPEINLQGLSAASMPLIALYLVALGIAVMGATVASIGYFHGHVGWPERAALAAAALMIIAPDLWVWLPGAAISMAVLARRHMGARRALQIS